MKTFLVLLLVVSCGKRSNNSGHSDSYLSTVLASEALAVTCSQRAYNNRCSRVVSYQVLPSYELLGPYCLRLYTSCMAGR